MGKIQELYETRVRPMVPAERLQLARLILDDLATTEHPVDISDEWNDDDLAEAAAASAHHGMGADPSERDMNPGDVVWIEFPGVVQTKRRPAVILSSTAYHAARPDIIVGLVTSQTSKSTAPTDHLLQDWQAAGLRVPSAFRAFIVTLPRTSIASTMGTLTNADWDEVVVRVKLAMELT